MGQEGLLFNLTKSVEDENSEKIRSFDRVILLFKAIFRKLK